MVFQKIKDNVNNFKDNIKKNKIIVGLFFISLIALIIIIAIYNQDIGLPIVIASSVILFVSLFANAWAWNNYIHYNLSTENCNNILKQNQEKSYQYNVEKIKELNQENIKLESENTTLTTKTIPDRKLTIIVEKEQLKNASLPDVKKGYQANINKLTKENGEDSKKIINNTTKIVRNKSTIEALTTMNTKIDNDRKK
jgi:hypothetical protein